MLKIVASVADGSLVYQHPDNRVDRLLGKHLDWQEVPGTRQEAGSFYQADFSALVSREDVEKIQKAGIENISIESV